MSQEQRKNLRCFRCSLTGHKAEHCAVRVDHPGQPVSRCKECQSPTHSSAQCNWNKTKVSEEGKKKAGRAGLGSLVNTTTSNDVAKLVVIKGMCGNLHCEILLDTGACKSLISQQACEIASGPSTNL